MIGNEAARLAAAINLLRPDWPAASLQTFINRHLQRYAYRDAAIAMTYVATDPDSQTPRRVLEPGPWWRVGDMAPTPHPPRANERCKHHPGEHRDRCRCCAADRLAGGAA